MMAAQTDLFFRPGRIGYGKLIMVTDEGLSLHFHIDCNAAKGEACNSYCEVEQLIFTEGFSAQPLGRSDTFGSWPEDELEEKMSRSRDLNPLEAVLSVADLHEAVRPGLTAFQAHHEYSHGRRENERQASETAFLEFIRASYAQFKMDDWERVWKAGGPLPTTGPSL